MPSTRSGSGPIEPPHWLVHDFLDADTIDALFDWVWAHERDFVPSRTGFGNDGEVRAQSRVSSLLRDLGPFERTIQTRLRELQPAAMAALRPNIAEVSRLELEIVAHGDGAFFAPHIDSATHGHEDHDGNLRLVSGVFYFHRQPRGFEGGDLRLHPLRPGDPAIDIAPVHNSLAMFLSWMPHEVLPVRVPSRDFRDSRFAINCWVWGTPAGRRSARPT